MNIYTIYRATNITTSKVYIGFDAKWPKRKSEHKTASKYQTFKFYNAIRKYGWEDFEWDIIYQSTDYNHCLNIMEQYFIDEYDSIRNGYNSTNGGGNGALGSSWWNNGIRQVFTQIPPDETFNKGRLNFDNVGGRAGAEVQRGKFWINNGTDEMMIHPGIKVPSGYKIGRLTNKAFAGGSGRHSSLGSRWWHNGINQVMAKECPGPSWVHGRLRGGGYGTRNS